MDRRRGNVRDCRHSKGIPPNFNFPQATAPYGFGKWTGAGAVLRLCAALGATAIWLSRCPRARPESRSRRSASPFLFLPVGCLPYSSRVAMLRRSM